MIFQTFPYQTRLEAFIATPSKEKRPLVILCHNWRGRDEFICEKAKEVASWGYVGFALDMYGKGVIGNSRQENAALKKPFMDDRILLQKRVLEGFEAASHLPYVDSSRMAVLGFGFGAVCALDLARSGVDVKGAISIYGHFDPPPYKKSIRAKILVLHGYDDPIANQEELGRFEKEMTEAKVDWQAHLFGNTYHAFALPSANDKEAGILYNPLSAQRAWRLVKEFLHETLS